MGVGHYLWYPLLSLSSPGHYMACFISLGAYMQPGEFGLIWGAFEGLWNLETVCVFGRAGGVLKMSDLAGQRWKCSLVLQISGGQGHASAMARYRGVWEMKKMDTELKAHNHLIWVHLSMLPRPDLWVNKKRPKRDRQKETGLLLHGFYDRDCVLSCCGAVFGRLCTWYHS